MTFALTGLDHVQLAMPTGAEQAARDYYGELLGMHEVAKPTVLAARGGVWFAAAGIEVHLGVEQDFQPARKAHPCFRVAGLGELARRLEAAGYPVQPDRLLPGVERFYTSDPFGNRLEFQAESAAP